MEYDIIHFMTCSRIISFSNSFLNARISPKENSGANGKFLPKPLLFHLRHPNSKKISRVFCQILSPKNSFGKTESALVPPPARILGGQNTKEKCPFLFRRNWSRANPKSKEHFSLVSAEALRGGGGAVHSFSFRSKKVRANARITPPVIFPVLMYFESNAFRFTKTAKRQFDISRRQTLCLPRNFSHH